MTQTTTPRRADRHQQKPSPLRDPRALLDKLPRISQFQKQFTNGMRPQRGVPPQRRAPLWRRVLKYWWVWLLPFVGLAAGAGIGMVYVFGQVPAPRDLPIAATNTIVAADGSTIGTLASEENRVEVPLSKVSANMRNAVLAAEDHEFYEHGAVSYQGILRAAWANVVERRVAQGGSTLTQQYVKIAHLTQERTILRKVNEVILAIKLEQQLSKDKILENYLNAVYFGRGAYGVEAAAHAYFGDTAENLDPQQAAFLAGIIRNPNFYDQEENVEAAKDRRNTVLATMGQLTAPDGQPMLPPGDAGNWIASNVDLVDQRSSVGVVNSAAPHFMEKVRLKLVEELGEARVAQGGLKVVTTLDPTLQAAAKNAVEGTVVDGADAPNVALTAIDPRSGAVTAMYGGRDFANRQFNYATDAPRQAGSTMKPLVLATALEGGLSIASRFDAGACVTGLDQDPTKALCNFGQADYGEVTLLESTVRSANTSFLRLIQQVTPERVAATASDCGFGSVLTQSGEKPANLPQVPSLALGAGEVNTLQLTSAYAAVANRGVYMEPYIVQQVVDAAGNERYRQRETPDSRRRCMSESTAATVAFALQAAVEEGTGRAARIGGIDAAGKTGSTNDNVDARFAGFTPDLAASVWMGFDDATRQLRNIQNLEQVTGGSLPAQVWQAFMTGARDAERLSGAPFPPADLSLGTVQNPAPEDEDGDGDDGDGQDDGDGDGEDGGGGGENGNGGENGGGDGGDGGD